MNDRSIDELRDELRNLGYLSHGLERWFAHDPWKSGTFWTELTVVASKASLVIALFAAATATAVMLLRNEGGSLVESGIMAMLYFTASFVTAMIVHLAVAMTLKAKPSFGIEQPSAMMMIAMTLSGLFALIMIGWWSGFSADPRAVESVTFIALLVLLFVASSIVVSAALLSFSIHEARAIPTIHRKPRTIPLILGALVLLLLILGRSCADSETGARLASPQIVVQPRDARIALIAIDGLTPELFELRPELYEGFAEVTTPPPLAASSAPEAWSTIGTGTLPSLHGVRSVEGIRLLGGIRIVQRVSRHDLVLRHLAPMLGLAERQPLPPSVRDRHFVWETLSARGVPAIALNWWTTEDGSGPALRTISQETIFVRAGRSEKEPTRLALAIDRLTIAELVESLDRDRYRFATVYLPALDVILNRIVSDDRAKLASTIQALDQIAALVESLSARGWTLVLVATPGAGEGEPLIAATNDLDVSGMHLLDVAPTILGSYGFPPSLEMPGESAVSSLPPVSSYGSRESTDVHGVDDEYYESLRSLGYIQ